jgi:integrase
MVRRARIRRGTGGTGDGRRLPLLFGFVGALRRSELVSLQVEDVAVVAGGLRLRLWKRSPPLRADRVSFHGTWIFPPSRKTCSPSLYPSREVERI